MAHARMAAPDDAPVNRRLAFARDARVGEIVPLVSAAMSAGIFMNEPG